MSSREVIEADVKEIFDVLCHQPVSYKELLHKALMIKKYDFDLPFDYHIIKGCSVTCSDMFLAQLETDLQELYDNDKAVEVIKNRYWNALKKLVKRKGLWSFVCDDVAERLAVFCLIDERRVRELGVVDEFYKKLAILIELKKS